MGSNCNTILVARAGVRRRVTVSATLILAIAVAMLPLSATSAWATSHEKVLHAFRGSDGEQPNGSLVFDKAGNLYGTTSAGGANGVGNVFKLTPGINSTWTETVLHDFDRTDGAYPQSSLIFDKSGNLYGTTSEGGLHGNGTVFKLALGPDGSWSESVLFSFNGLDGAEPFGSLVFDAQGDLYGTAWQGGDFSGGCIYGGCGTVFKLSLGSDGEWTGKAIHVFNGKDGSAPFCNMIFDAAGNLYGTTTGVLSNYVGTVFKLTPGTNGQWSETVLHTFAQDAQLYSGLTLDKAGNLYGTTWTGGAHFAGSVFKLTPEANGKWTETTLHSFNNKDGSFAYAGVIFDAAGNLWGTTSGYGSDLGSVYELVPGSNGRWTINVLQTFDDMQVNGGVLFDGVGNVYSTSFAGGILTGCNTDQNGCGTVFEVTR